MRPGRAPRMAFAALIGASVVAATAALAAAGPTKEPTSRLRAAASNIGPSFKVASTLDGKTVLPHRIHWLVFPGPRTQVREVAFLVDGKLRWVEHGAPYSYSDDGGYLVTSWLSPGLHRFTVRVLTTTGRTGTDTVIARAVPAPAPSPELAGTWQRKILNTVADPHGDGDAPAGTWRLVFDRRWIQDRAPGRWNPTTSPKTGFGGIVDNDWVPGAKTFEIAGAVTTGIVGDKDAEGGWWCAPGGPVARYSWSVSDDRLTLAPIGVDACYQRGAVYTGEWTRVP